jgi:hypothetical protein
VFIFGYRFTGKAAAMSQSDQNARFPTDLVSKDLLLDLGRELDAGALPGAPSSPEDLISAAKRWLNYNFATIQLAICPHCDRILKTIDHNDAEAVAAVADLLTGVFIGVTPFTVGKICTRAGLKHLCDGYASRA